MKTSWSHLSLSALATILGTLGLSSATNANEVESNNQSPAVDAAVAQPQPAQLNVAAPNRVLSEPVTQQPVSIQSVPVNNRSAAALTTPASSNTGDPNQVAAETATSEIATDSASSSQRDRAFAPVSTSKMQTPLTTDQPVADREFAPETPAITDIAELTETLSTKENHESTVDKSENALDAPQPDSLAPSSDIATENPANTEVAQGVNPVRILLPEPGTMRERSTSLVIQYPAGLEPVVIINDEPLHPETPTQIEPDPENELVTQIWYNIQLDPGENVLSVQAGDFPATSVEVLVKELAATLTVRPAGNPSAPADGRSWVQLSGEVKDRDGNLLPGEIVVTLTASAGKFVGADWDLDRPGFQVIAQDGAFFARLQSSLDPQQVKVRAAIEVDDLKGVRADRPTPPELIPDSLSSTGQVEPYRDETEPFFDDPDIPLEDIEAYTQVEFAANLRPWVFSGSIDLHVGQKGTNFYSRFRDFLDPNDIDDGVEADFGAAVFARGQIGEWLFTGAYNSRRALNEDCDGEVRLFRQDQFCDHQYPVYGDSSSVDFLTPSIDSVYVRLERTSPVEGAEADYIMWGDFRTQEFARSSQLFSATNRPLHGLKGNFSIGNLQLTGFYSEQVRGFQRDAIAPNGTSGYYFLSRRLVLPGSEAVFLETEELNRPGTVLERRRMQRGPDYEIDYDRGSLLFRRPILSVNSNPFGLTTVQRIVVTYEYEGEGNDTHIYGGRAQYNFVQGTNNPIWAAASYLREDQGARDFELYGGDFFVSLGRTGRIVGEYAHSKHQSVFLGDRSGDAYRLEIDGAIGSILHGRAYFKAVDEEFANDATFSFVPGQTRYGAQVAAAVSPSTTFRVGYDYESNYGIAARTRSGFDQLFNPGIEAIPGTRVDNSLSTIRAGIQQRIGKANLSLDYVNRARTDRNVAGEDLSGDASQLVTGLYVPILSTLAFRAQNEANLGGSDSLFPTRTTFGLDWDALPGVKLRLAHQFLSGGKIPNNSITTLDTILEHNFTEDTSISGRYTLLNATSGLIGEGAIGLNHRWRIAPGFRLDLAYERIFSNNFVQTGTGQQFRQPFAVGQSAAALGLGSGDSYSVGLEYTDNPDFQVAARFERRNSVNGNATVWSAAASGRITNSLTSLFRFQQASASNQLLSGLDDTVNLRLGLAYRNPKSDKFNALLRYEYRRNPSTIPETLLIGSNINSTEQVFGVEAIYTPHWRWELYGKHVFRLSSSTLADDFTNRNLISLSQFRVVYRLNYRFDLAGETRVIRQASTSFTEWGWAAELGYYVTPDLRVGVGYSFGSVDDRDFSGFRSDGGPYFTVALKLNGLVDTFFGPQRLVPKQQRETEIDETLAIDEQVAPSAREIYRDRTGTPVSVEQLPLATTPATDGEEFPVSSNGCAANLMCYQAQPLDISALQLPHSAKAGNAGSAALAVWSRARQIPTSKAKITDRNFGKLKG